MDRRRRRQLARRGAQSGVGGRQRQHRGRRQGSHRGGRRASLEWRLRSHARGSAARARRRAAHPRSSARDGRADPVARAADRGRARDYHRRRPHRAGAGRRADRTCGAQARARRGRHCARPRIGADARPRPAPRALLGDRATHQVERRAARRAHRAGRRPLPVRGGPRRALAALGTSAMLVLLAHGVDAAPPCPGCVVAGAGRAPLAVPDGTPLAGYGSFGRRLVVPDVFDRYPHAFWFKPARADGDGLAARALVLERDGTRVVWVALDLLAVDRAFSETVAARLLSAGVAPGVLILSASHTHSGPGAFVDSALMGFVALDREDAAVREALVAAVVEAVRRADAARGPARLAVGITEAPPVVRSRLGGPLDRELTVLAVR